MENEATPKKEKKAASTPHEPAYLAQYRKTYPSCKTFYVTADDLVFLANQLKQAQAHQKTLGKGELRTY